MTKSLKYVAAIALVCIAASCRKNTDLVYNPEDAAYRALKFSTMEGQWDYMWNAMNNNYVYWEYDNTDWDAVYKPTAAKFKALDENYKTAYNTLMNNPYTTVEQIQYFTAETQQALLDVLSELDSQIDLVDAHLSMKFYNIYGLTQGSDGYWYNTSVSYMPANDRLAKRKDYHLPATNAGAIYENPAYTGVDYIFDNILAKYDVIPDYATLGGNDWAYSCRIPYSDDKSLVYLRLGSCILSDIAPGNALYTVIASGFFQRIIDLKSTRELGGVILDCRDNAGGYSSDLNVFPGLFAKHSAVIGRLKTKNGLGRYDYGLWKELTAQPNYNSQFRINDLGVPFVFLQDMHTMSMGEIMGQACCYTIDNAVTIGESTFGSLGSILVGYPDLYHAGPVNFNNISYQPSIYMSTMCMENADRTGRSFKCLEGEGIAPDIECAMDYGALKACAGDNQLDRAVEYIKNGR